MKSINRSNKQHKFAKQNKLKKVPYDHYFSSFNNSTKATKNNSGERLYLMGTNDISDPKVFKNCKCKNRSAFSSSGLRVRTSSGFGNKKGFCEPTRFLPNSTFTNCFKKPAFEAYGRGNINPVYGGLFYGNYMDTFNSRPNYNNTSKNTYYFLDDDDIRNSLWKTNEFVRENKKLYDYNDNFEPYNISPLEAYYLNKYSQYEDLYNELCGINDREPEYRYLSGNIDPYRSKYNGGFGDRYNEKIDRDLYVRLRLKYLEHLKKKREEYLKRNKEYDSHINNNSNNDVNKSEQKIDVNRNSSNKEQEQQNQHPPHTGCGCDRCSCEECSFKKAEIEKGVKTCDVHQCECECQICENCKKNYEKKRRIIHYKDEVPAGMPSPNNYQRLNLFRPITNLNNE